MLNKNEKKEIGDLLEASEKLRREVAAMLAVDDSDPTLALVLHRHSLRRFCSELVFHIGRVASYVP